MRSLDSMDIFKLIVATNYNIIEQLMHNSMLLLVVYKVEGGFVMGIGNVTTEELIFDDHGRLLTDGTWEYKPPCPKSIPKVKSIHYTEGSVFNVSIKLMCAGLASDTVSWHKA